jgi:HSP20 family protein
MPEGNVVKPPKQELGKGVQTPLFRGRSLFHLNPFSLMRQFTDELDRLFNQAPAVRTEGAENWAWSPVIEVKEKGGKLLLSAEIPGVRKEDVKVTIDNGMLRVEGEKKEEKEEKRDGYYHSERSYGTFYRSIQLPEGAKAEQATARFNNGVLEVTVPIPEAKTKSQNVPIQEEGAKAATKAA